MRYDHIIIDFEMNPVYPQLRERSGGLDHEILEFGAVRLDGTDLRVKSTFQSLVRPTFVHKVDSRITRMTGITRADAAAAPPLGVVLNRFLRWLGSGPVRIYSWSDTDLFQLHSECVTKGIEFPLQLLDWVDLQAQYPGVLGRRTGECLGLLRAAELLGIPVVRERCHYALYDAQITAKLLQFFLTGSFRMDAYRVRPAAAAGRDAMTYSIAEACGGQLCGLLDRLRCQQEKELIPIGQKSFTGPDPVLVRSN